MMAANLFSRLIPTGHDETGENHNDRPFYERLDNERGADVENHAGLALDEENLSHQFHQDDLRSADRFGMDDSRVSTGSGLHGNERDESRQESGQESRQEYGQGRSRSRWHSSGSVEGENEGDNAVPASLLMEHTSAAAKRPPRSNLGSNSGRPKKPPRRQAGGLQEVVVPGPSDGRSRAQWEAAQMQQPLYQDDEMDDGRERNDPRIPGPPGRRVGGFISADPKEKALFRWANVSNLDMFIKDVYNYYLAAGYWCILVGRVLHVVKVVFVSGLLTLLTQCIDYSKIRESKTLAQTMVPKCTAHMWWVWNLGLWLCSFYVVWKIIQFVLDIPRLRNIRDFYTYLLEIPEEDMQTVSWQDVVVKITALRDQNLKTATSITPSQRHFLHRQLGARHAGELAKERLDAHDIANRLMRRENYIIALFNKDILDMSLPFWPHRPFLSQILLWSLHFSILDLVFNEKNQVRPQVLRSDCRGQLSRSLRVRFAFAAVTNLILAPFVAAFLLIDFVFTYYNEFKTNTSAAGTKQYTPLAQWKFREFNELPHLFKERLNMSYPFAKHYMDQFPKMKTEAAATTVRFVAGSLIAVLAIVGFQDPEMFVEFDIFPGMNALAFLAICTTAWAVAHGMITEENDVFDPEYAMQNVIEYTHYQPDEWKGRLHSNDVKAEFAELYKLKLVVFLEEVLGILVTPIILFFSLPNTADQIVDFFREFTIHVDGLGYVCSFAVFDFQKDTRNAKQRTNNRFPNQNKNNTNNQPGGGNHNEDDARDDYYATKHGKMQASLYGFLDNYVYHPKTGLPGPAGRHHPHHHPHHLHQHQQFQMPPVFPPLNSPVLAADASRPRSSRATPSKQRFPHPHAQHQPSPMASLLLDPHNHPRGAKGMRRETYPGSAGLGRTTTLEHQQEQEQEQDGDGEDTHLGESAWEDDARAVSRENSGAAGAEGEEGRTGVVGLLRQFQAAHRQVGGNRVGRQGVL